MLYKDCVIFFIVITVLFNKIVNKLKENNTIVRGRDIARVWQCLLQKHRWVTNLFLGWTDGNFDISKRQTKVFFNGETHIHLEEFDSIIDSISYKYLYSN